MKIFNAIRKVFTSSLEKLPAGASRAERGRYGEELAASFCRDKLGIRIIARNWRYKRDEIDLIGSDRGVLVFVEVRSRSEHSLQSGFHTVTASKKKALLRACRGYIKQLQKKPKHIRFDIIDVVLRDGGHGEPRHYANIQLFPKHYICGDERRQ